LCRKDIVREEIWDVSGLGLKNLQDWMKVVQDMSLTLGGFGGTGYTFLDAISDG